MPVQNGGELPGVNVEPARKPVHAAMANIDVVVDGPGANCKRPSALPFIRRNDLGKCGNRDRQETHRQQWENGQLETHSVSPSNAHALTRLEDYRQSKSGKPREQDKSRDFCANLPS
jgi:hypothetical protein